MKYSHANHIILNIGYGTMQFLHITYALNVCCRFFYFYIIYLYIYIFTFIVLCLIVSSTVCSTFHIQKLHLEIEVPGSMWICGSVTAPRLTKIDPIGCSTILDFG